MIDLLSEGTTLGPAGEQAWQTLRSHTEWANGFWVAWLFTGHTPMAREFEARMEALLGERGQRQIVLRPATPEEARTLLEAILSENTRDVHCVWAEILHSDGPTLGDESNPGPWTEAWDWLMMRANERRTALERHLPGGLVFVGPSAFKDRARRAAPDLWSIRTLVLEPAPPQMQPSSGMLEPLPEPSLLQQHAEFAPDVELALDQAARMRARGLRRDEATALLRAARGLLARGEIAEALRRTHEAVDAAGTLDPEHIHTAQLLNDLGRLLHDQGCLAEARPFFERALAIREKQLGPEHPYTAQSLNNLAMLLKHQGALGKARPLYERALAISAKQLGPEHPLTATNLNNLGALLYAQGAIAEARPLLERALAIREKQLGPEHPDTASILNNLVVLLQEQGALAEARPLGERALAINEKQLGPEHPHTTQSLNNLASLLRDQGALAEAKRLYERALAINEKQIGPEHPDMATSLNNLAALLQDQGALAEAQLLYERARSIYEKHLGSEHPDTAMSLNNLAGVRYAQGALAEARLLYERALAICEAKLGPGHPRTKLVQSNLQDWPEP
jgi:tetratricopeptide (TPR) repeat protein